MCVIWYYTKILYVAHCVPLYHVWWQNVLYVKWCVITGGGGGMCGGGGGGGGGAQWTYLLGTHGGGGGGGGGKKCESGTTKATRNTWHTLPFAQV